MSDEWGPWIEHDGRGCTCVGMSCEVVYFPARADSSPGSIATGGRSWFWTVVNGRPVSPGKKLSIIRYRIRKPRALEQLREIARNPERELEDA